jgi:Kelch motif
MATAILALGCGTRPPDLPRPGAPSIDKFGADASLVVAGGTVTLTWSASGATALRIEPGVGDVTGLVQATVKPTRTTSYALVATNDKGAVSAEVTVRTAAFVPVAPMHTPRSGATATLLFDGKILVTGGDTGSGPTDTAEVFDPATNAFTPTAGPMAVARQGHLARLLASGEVVIMGGRGAAGALASAELWSPATGTFSSLGNLTAAREGFTANLLGSGRHLLAGGASSSSSEVFSGSIFTFTRGPTPARARAFHSAASLAGGGVVRVYLTGGTDLAGALVPSTEFYDDGAASFTVGPDLLEPRADHASMLVGQDKVLVLGGRNASGALRSLETVDFAAKTRAPAGELAEARSAFLLEVLSDGRLLLVGGLSSAGAPLASTEILEPSTGALLAGPSLGVARGRACSSSTFDGRLLVAGGTSGSSPTASAEVLEKL